MHYIVLPEQQNGDIHPLGEAAEAAARPVVRFCSPEGLWRNGFAYTEHAFQCQQLYQLRK